MYSEIFKENFWTEILRKYGVEFSLTFENNLRIKGFENFEKNLHVCRKSAEISEKF